MSDELAVAVTQTGATTTLVVRGPLTMYTSATLSMALRKYLLDCGRVLVDVSGLRLLWHQGVTVFATALDSVGGWPAARLALFGVRGALATHLHATGLSSRVHLAVDAAAAAGLLEHRPARVRRSIDLAPTVRAPALARLLLVNACEDWQLDDALKQRAIHVVDQLVGNAIEHAVGRRVLRIELDARGLGVALDDGSPAVADLRARKGAGLSLVEELSDGWGVAPSRTGKTVWALLRLPGRGRPL